MNDQKINESPLIEKIFEQSWREQAAQKDQKEQPSTEKFKVLPNGTYVGRVNVLINTVASEANENYGLKKYELQLTVTEGEFKGKMAYFHFVIIKHSLMNPPPESNHTAFARWQAAIKISREKADKFLASCGVNTRVENSAALVQNIAENNRRRTLVNFTMKDGTPHINHVVGKPVEDEVGSLFPLGSAAAGLPDGNDLPLA